MQIQKLTSVPANDVVENVFAGSAFEFPTQNVVVSLGSVQEATGLFITIQNGGIIELEESPPAINADFPIIPDEFYYNFGVASGQRLVLRVRNSTAGAINLRSIAMMQPTR